MIYELLNTIPQIGTVQWLGVRPMQIIQEVIAIAEKGLENYRHKNAGKRQVTLI
jgi:hypothetical protein